jgi:hypothetical protein
MQLRRRGSSCRIGIGITFTRLFAKGICSVAGGSFQIIGWGPAPQVWRILAARGNLLVRPTTAPSKYHFGEVFQSQGPAGDLDDTGLTILVTLANGRSLLLTGDADYTYAINTYRLWRRRRPRYSGQSRNAGT